MRNIFRSPSSLLFLSFFLFWSLQQFPLPGILLMLFGASIICGLLLLAFMITLFFEALSGWLPRWLIFIPIVFFTHYYLLFFNQAKEINNLEAELQQTNPTIIYGFNSDLEHLVTKNASSIVTNYRIPVVFSKTSKNKFFSHRMISKQSCASIPKDSEARIQTSNVVYRESPLLGRKFGRQKTRKGFCRLRMPETPSKTILEVKTNEQKVWKHKPSIEIGKYTLLKNGIELGQYRTASVWRYGIFPLPRIGCFLNSSRAKWECFYDYKKSLYRLKTNPSSMGQELNINPVALMLGLQKYNEKDYSKFKEYTESANAIAEASGLADKIVNDMFEHLDLMMLDHSTKIAWRMEYTLTKDPARIAERTDRILEYLKILESKKTTGVYELESKKKLFLSLLVWLPDDQLKVHGTVIFNLLKNYKKLSYVSELYLRLADFEKDISGLSVWYEDHFNNSPHKHLYRYMPVSALCRAGGVTKTTNALMRNDFNLGAGKNKHSQYHEALFLTLLKLGEEEFLKKSLASQDLWQKKWYYSVLEGNAVGPYGPNNCMVRQGRLGKKVPTSLKRILKKY